MAHRPLLLAELLLFLVVIAEVDATDLILKDGRLLQGKRGETSGLADPSQAASSDGSGAAPTIVFLNDDLRRTFVSKRLIREMPKEQERKAVEKIRLPQRALGTGTQIKSLGPMLKVQPFDEFGRRTVTISIDRGPLDVIQGITELTPDWCKIEAIRHVWDMRLATSSIPPDALRRILLKQIDEKETDPAKKQEQYKKVARFYILTEHYAEARKTLDDMLAEFPDDSDLKEQLASSFRSITQLRAQQIVRELRLRRDAGQHQFVSRLLEQFPNEGVTGEILQGVRQMSQDYSARSARLQEVVKKVQTLSEGLKSKELQEGVQAILAEIANDMSLDTLDRMATFLQNTNDEASTDSDKVALALSGWLLGADAATSRLDTALSIYKVRDLVRKYLLEPNEKERETVLRDIRKEYASDLETIAALIARMKPPCDLPDAVPDKPGFYELKAASLEGEPPTTYLVQLPPEYDPYRRYPTIVALHSAINTAEQEIDWWAGEWKNGQRAGQATRHGYIVIAPIWNVKEPGRYCYSAKELAAVLNPLHDACRHFSIDTDRVYLSGHSTGGDAAWDIGLAHPDLWAGVVPIVARAERYCIMYWPNAKQLPFYVVAGELDGGRLASNADSLNRYLKRGYEATVVEYIGRGHDDFHDEILRIFDWMPRHTRVLPTKFACNTMRPWDNSFWWVEMQGMPPKSMVDPANWSNNNPQPMEVSSTIANKRSVTVQAGSTQVAVWLSPDMVDFKQRITVSVNGRRLNSGDPVIRPELKTLLEDVRTRADRQHPYWAKLEGSTGRVHRE